MANQNTRPGTAGFTPAVADADAQDGFSNDAPADATKASPQGKRIRQGASGKEQKPSPDLQKVTGAGPALARHSKDAKTKSDK